MIVLAFIIVLAFTSVGVDLGGVCASPGWWPWNRYGSDRSEDQQRRSHPEPAALRRSTSTRSGRMRSAVTSSRRSSCGAQHLAHGDGHRRCGGHRSSASSSARGMAGYYGEGRRLGAHALHRYRWSIPLIVIGAVLGNAFRKPRRRCARRGDRPLRVDHDVAPRAR